MTISQYEKIAINFAQARENAGRTQAEVANYLGVTYQAVSNWERGRSKIDSVSLLRSLLWFGVDIYDFLGKCDFEMAPRIGNEVTERERALLKSFYSMNEEGQENVCQHAADIASIAKYQRAKKTKSLA